MLIIGLTGGIGSGKSTAAALFAERGVPVIDTDQLARALVEPGQPALAEIVASFGPDVLDTHGRLDRAHLREQVFADAGARQRLEAILHPRIRAGVIAWLQTHAAPYAVVVVPLLLEGNLADLMDRVLVVDVPEAVQRTRAMARDGLTETQFNAILHSQADRTARLNAADEIIDNQGTEQALAEQVDALHRRYRALADAQPPERARIRPTQGTSDPPAG